MYNSAQERLRNYDLFMPAQRAGSVPEARIQPRGLGGPVYTGKAKTINSPCCCCFTQRGWIWDHDCYLRIREAQAQLDGALAVLESRNRVRVADDPLAVDAHDGAPHLDAG